jgi:hypothetical protein
VPLFAKVARGVPSIGGLDATILRGVLSPYVLAALANCSYAVVDDQIWQVWKNRNIRFAIPEYQVLAVSEQNQGRS